MAVSGHLYSDTSLGRTPESLFQTDTFATVNQTALQSLLKMSNGRLVYFQGCRRLCLSGFLSDLGLQHAGCGSA
eukprot:6197462-Pleurochrysis_carterae.AAC.3